MCGEISLQVFHQIVAVGTSWFRRNVPHLRLALFFPLVYLALNLAPANVFAVEALGLIDFSHPA